MLMAVYLSWAFVLSFIGGKWYDCGSKFRIMLMVAYLSWALVLSLIGSKWSDCGWEFQIILMIPISSGPFSNH